MKAHIHQTYVRLTWIGIHKKYTIVNKGRRNGEANMYGSKYVWLPQF